MTKSKPVDLRTLKSASRRQKEATSSREAAILSAAARIFGAKGFHAARTADIARAARTTERTMFKYFKTKADLFGRAMLPALLTASVEAGLDQTQSLFEREDQSFEDWQDALLRGRMEQSREVVPQLKMLMVTVLTDDTVRRWFVENWRGTVWQSALAKVAEFQAQGKVRADIPAEAATRAIISLNLSYIFTRLVLIPEAALDDEAELAATTRMVTELLAASRG